MGWRCKDCGEVDDYIINRNPVQHNRGTFNKEGEYIIDKEGSCQSYWFIECNSCGHMGFSIEGMAEWVEE